VVVLVAGAYFAQSAAKPLFIVLFAPAIAVQRIAVEFPRTLSQGMWHLLAALVQFAAILAIVVIVRVIIRKSKAK